MIVESKNGYKPFSEDSANRRLKWFIAFLKEDTWKNQPYFKIVTAWQIEDILRCAGYSWQADRVLNHLHAWMKGIKLLDKDSSQKKENDHSLAFEKIRENKANSGFFSRDLGLDPRDVSNGHFLETRFVAKKTGQRIGVDTLREKRIPQ